MSPSLSLASPAFPNDKEDAWKQFLVKFQSAKFRWDQGKYNIKKGREIKMKCTDISAMA